MITRIASTIVAVPFRVSIAVSASAASSATAVAVAVASAVRHGDVAFCSDCGRSNTVKSVDDVVVKSYARNSTVMVGLGGVKRVYDD